MKMLFMILLFCTYVEIEKLENVFEQNKLYESIVKLAISEKVRYAVDCKNIKVHEEVVGLIEKKILLL